MIGQIGPKSTANTADLYTDAAYGDLYTAEACINWSIDIRCARNCNLTAMTVANAIGIVARMMRFCA